MNKTQIRKRLKSDGWDRVRNVSKGEWHGLRETWNGGTGSYVFIAFSDQELLDRFAQQDRAERQASEV